MRKLFCGAVLLFSVLLVNTALGYYGDYGSYVSDFDNDLIWVGGEIIPGSPKFKVSQHPDGYSLQIGMGGMYIRARFSFADNSVDFAFSDYKGTAKYRANLDDPSLEGEIELVGGNRGPHTPIDATVKLKFKQIKAGQYRSPLDPYEMELSFTNVRSGGRHRSRIVEIGDEHIKNMKVLDMVIKATINPRNWAESTVNFNLGAEGELITAFNDQQYDRYGYRSYGDPYDYAEGTYNISASLMIINVVEPSSSERQPKITMALDLETNRNVPNGNNGSDVNYPNQRSWKKSILFDGTINLTGKGARLGVMKVTDAITGNSIGRVQARRSDSDNLRLEFFESGRQEVAINYLESSNGATNITLEKTRCGSVRSFRIYERIIGDSSLEQRFYKDIFYIGEPCSYMQRELQGDRGMIWEEKMSATIDQYMYNVLVSGGYEFNNLYVNLDNRGQNTKFQFGTMNKYLDRYQGDSLILRNSDRVEVEIKPSTDEVGEFDMKISCNNDRLFDGWFIGTKAIRRYAREKYPAALQQSFDRYQSMHNQTISVLTEYV